MTTARKSIGFSMVCGCLLAVTVSAQTMVDGFEYASDGDLLAAWFPQTSTLSLSAYVAPKAAGTNSLRVERLFAAAAYDTEIITGPVLPAPMAIGSGQYFTLRVAGDPQFTNASWQTLFLYAFDGANNFGRVGGLVPITTNWQVFNFVASSMQQPWDSPALPDLNNIVQFKFYLYGQGEPPGAEYSATVYIDELMVRDTPLVEVEPTTGPATIEDFESYASDGDMLAAWSPYTGTLALSSNVAARSAGTNSLRVDRYFAATAWDTEVITGPVRPIPMAIAPTQYLTFRISGDPQFTNASWQTLYLYAFDGANNFGRWGGPVPMTNDWQVVNFLASTIAQPWDSPALPDLNNIVQYKFYLYGQGDPPGAEFPATLYIDDLMLRDTPLIEFPPPSPMRAKIDDFEQYADATALLGFYHHVNGAPTTVTTASLETPAPQGTKALKLAIDFGAGQWPWGSVYSAPVAPFSLPTNAAVSLWFKGDPILAPVADDGTVFYLSFYDQGGNAIHFTTSAPVISSEWTRLQAGYDQFWSSAVVDTGNLVQWRILVEGWMGTADSTPLSGSFYVDDIQVTVPPVLAIVREGSTLTLRMDSLIPGTTYTLRQTANFSQWTTSTFQATAASQTWPIPAGDKGFYQLYYTP